ncbi:uncharacterized protein LY79DRAFT_660725 [Colletotrichum navitas]|uniref:Uncharacterized protein n=1 Tax=Colletotrichum navitas TaxID=681940 RepID=A0AAD8PV17_9PEZI|nr:uncharacterized protein LY79DRAFT_660725 [Colletotrichum navitas]KAK1585012.1 hypothetical protein LY79DRAFT_660725 [Colletotrichum navitas]
MIRLLNESAEPLNLRSLELQWSFDDDSDHSYEALSGFFQEFQGLEELFLSTSAPAYPVEIWRVVLHHRASLRRFVHHQHERPLSWYRQRVDELSFRREIDSPNFESLEPSDCWSLGRLDLTSLGLCCKPITMKMFVSEFASRTTLQVLHVRQSGPYLDYSSSSATMTEVDYDGCFEHATLLLCRQDAPCGIGNLDTEDAKRETVCPKRTSVYHTVEADLPDCS